MERARFTLPPEAMVRDRPANAKGVGEFALKLIDGNLATEDILHQYRAEQDILATIDHPNIAQYVDQGVTDDGLPYLVMEFVDGQHIDHYCDEKKLAPAECSALMLQVCKSVAFVHARGAAFIGTCRLQIS